MIASGKVMAKALIDMRGLNQDCKKLINKRTKISTSPSLFSKLHNLGANSFKDQQKDITKEVNKLTAAIWERATKAICTVLPKDSVTYKMAELLVADFVFYHNVSHSLGITTRAIKFNESYKASLSELEERKKKNDFDVTTFSGVAIALNNLNTDLDNVVRTPVVLNNNAVLVNWIFPSDFTPYVEAFSTSGKDLPEDVLRGYAEKLTRVNKQAKHHLLSSHVAFIAALTDDINEASPYMHEDFMNILTRVQPANDDETVAAKIMSVIEKKFVPEDKRPERVLVQQGNVFNHQISCKCD